jgi:hypothetical protein
MQQNSREDFPFRTDADQNVYKKANYKLCFINRFKISCFDLDISIEMHNMYNPLAIKT